MQAKLVIKSVFEHGQQIPKEYTCEGRNISPKLIIQGLDEKVKSIAIIMDDPDAPMGTFVHWVVWDLPPGNVEEGTKKGVNGITSFNRLGYGGPCPPKGHGKHRYYFKVYGLDKKLGLKEGLRKEELLKAMEGHVIAYGELMGTYERK
ncbi:MAG: YbhB/YbcL family Raf kinase inhibitor-like protein [Candidatus Anstonellales archaeon]